MGIIMRFNVSARVRRVNAARGGLIANVCWMRILLQAADRVLRWRARAVVRSTGAGRLCIGAPTWSVRLLAGDGRMERAAIETCPGASWLPPDAGADAVPGRFAASARVNGGMLGSGRDWPVRRIVILGAGYAGVRAAQVLLADLGDHELTVIDRASCHQIVTEMYRVASGDLPEERVCLPIWRLLPAHPRLTVLQAEVQEIRPRDREVATERGRVPYDLLVVALGATTEYYDVPGARRHALTLQYLDSAVRLRRRLRELAARERGGRLVIIGGGLTGVELAGEIRDSFPEHFDLTIVQAAPAILPEEDAQLAAFAQRELEAHRITVHRGTAVREVRPHSVLLENGAELPADLTVWTGGVRANELPAAAGLPCGQRGRVLVDAHLEVQGWPGIFAAGDVAAVPARGGAGLLPPTAQLAVQEGAAVGRNIRRVLADREPASFTPHILGSAASVGRSAGIAHIGRLRLTGKPGHVLHELALLRYLYGLGGIGLLRREGYLSWTHPPAPPAAGQPRNRSAAH